MPWTYDDDLPILRWSAVLTAAAPMSDPLALTVHDASVQIEGDFGPAAVEIAGSNSGDHWVPWCLERHAEILRIPVPTAWLRVTLADADASTAVRITVAGRR